MEDIIYILVYIDEFGDIVLNKSKVWVIHQTGKVRNGAGNEIVDADNLVSPFNQQGTKMGTNKTSSASNKNLQVYSILEKITGLFANKILPFMNKNVTIFLEKGQVKITSKIQLFFEVLKGSFQTFFKVYFRLEV